MIYVGCIVFRSSKTGHYPITVLRGHSVSEPILSDREIGYTGISQPHVVIALAQEGVAKRKHMLQNLPNDTLVIKVKGVELPPIKNKMIEVDLKAQKIKSTEWALAALSVMAGKNQVITMEMLKAALAARFKGQVFEGALALVGQEY